VARGNRGTAHALGSVSLRWYEKYFEQVGNRFAFSKEFRRSVIFGRNDLVQDAPISHVDILTCRNTLMYFTAETQAQILNRMHFALRPDGILFLGKAEMLLSHSAYFRPVELKRRFFRRIPTDTREPRALAVLPDNDGSADGDHQLDKLRHLALMSSAAAQIVLDADGKLALSNHRATHLFALTQHDLGRPFQDLEVSYRPVELRGHLAEALTHGRPTWVRDIELVRSGSETLSLDVQIIPLRDEQGAELGVTVVFHDVTQYRQLQRELQYANRQLETAYEELQSTNEELETTNEELQSTVEELETTNEELQSTNEELETMNEELQSMNDELQFSNEALRDRQEEVDRLNRFMTSVLSSMNAGVAVVDADMRVLAWNTRAEDLWGVRSDEAMGEHLMNLDIGLPVELLRQPLRAQLADESLAPQTNTVDAVNRRGRQVQLKVTISRIVDEEPPSSAMLVMEVVEDGV
jgi:two-component system CheB/CheR fusion protein